MPEACQTFGAETQQEKRITLADDTSFAPGTPLQRDTDGPVPKFSAQMSVSERTSRSQGDRIPGQAAISGPPR